LEHLEHKIIIRDWSYFTKSNDISGLKKYGVNAKNIESVVEIVAKNMNGKIDTTKDEDNLNSKFRIQELIVFYKSLHALMIHHLKVEYWMLEMNAKLLDDPRIKESREKVEKKIQEKAAKLKEKYGIDVKEIEDLEKIDKEIERRLDKYAEKNDKKEDIATMTFSESVIAIFKALDYDKVDWEMVLSDLFNLKDIAINGRTK